MSSRRNKNVRVSMHGGDAGSGGLTAPFHPHQLMLNGSKHDLINAKSQYEAEFRRFAIDASLLNTVEKLHTLLGELHGLNQAEFYITYIDKTDGELLPINNDDNYAQALRSYAPPSVLRIHIQRKDQEGRLSAYHHNGGGGRYSDSPGSRTPFRSLLMSRDHQINNYNSNSGGSASANLRRRNNQPGNLLQIGRPENFRPVSSIIDADILPETLRRVKMMKHNNERPLGFYIRDGVCVRPTSNGIEKVPGIYISRVVQGGLAESTGLLNVDDEVLEVNGIEVEGKTLDQVTDMMIANSSNLILTIKPANQGHISWSGGAAAGGTMGDRSSASKLSRGSAHGSASSSRSSGAGSGGVGGGASESLPRRAHANNSSITKESSYTATKTTKMPVVAESNRNGVGTSAGAGAGVGTSWGDAKFRTSQISQVSAASSSAASAASSSSMSIGGNVAGAGGGGAGSGASNHSPYDADDMDEVREFPSNTAAALEAINRQQLKQQQQQQRNSGMYRGSQSDYALSTTAAAAAVTAVNEATRREAPPPRRERDQPQYQPQQQQQPPSSSNTDFGFNNPAFNESMQAEYAAGDDAAASTTKNGSVKGRRSLRNAVVAGTDAANKNNSNGESNAAAAAAAGSSARSSAMDTF